MPDLALDQPITDVAISAISALSPNRPVFLLLGGDGSTLVIKAEMTPSLPQDTQNLKFAMKTMKAVDQGTAAKLLTSTELLYLANFIDTEEFIAGSLAKPPNQDLVRLKQALAVPVVTWFKMKKAEGFLSLESAIANLANGDKSGIRSIATALSNPDGLEQLGRILAADLFNGNHDRFKVGGSVNAQAGYQVLVNLGNIVTCIQHGQAQPSGLDPYEAQGDFRNIHQTVANLEANNPIAGPWPGRHLMNTVAEANWRRNFAQQIVDDIEQALGPRNRKIPLASKRRLPANAAVRLAAGMDQGIAQIKAKVLHWCGKPNCPLGITDRRQVLNW